MDFFNCRYYSLTRKLLILIGQWPYQNKTARITRNICVICISLSMIGVQIAKLVTSHTTMNSIAEVVAAQIGVIIISIKYLTISIQEKKIKLLLETVKADWRNLVSNDDRKITGEAAEEGRKYNFCIAVYLYSSLALAVVSFGLQPLIGIIILTNETYEKATLYPGEYFVDPDKYFYPILFHMALSVAVGVTILIATDTMYIACIYHACGMFNIVSHRLEHAFDNHKLDGDSINNINDQARTRIASAVKYHQTTLQYVDMLVSTFNIPLTLEIMLVFCNISITLYCLATSMGNLNEMMASLIFSMCQIIQSLIVGYPCQKMMDTSLAISFKGYCGQWYMAPCKSQKLILPIIQRGTKPTVISVAKIVVLSLETYAGAIQASLSYFTVLLSFK